MAIKHKRKTQNYFEWLGPDSIEAYDPNLILKEQEQMLNELRANGVDKETMKLVHEILLNNNNRNGIYGPKPDEVQREFLKTRYQYLINPERYLYGPFRNRFVPKTN